jgi:hypothetical protein
MKELDLLKKDWNKEQHPKVSSEAIYKMILKKSSSAVKWIFIISIIEFALGLISGVVYHPELNSEYKMPWIYGWPTTIFVTSIALYFIIVFYKNHKTINTTNSIKELLESIIKTRKTVKQYVIINLSYMAILTACVLSNTLTTPSNITGEIIFQLNSMKDYAVLVLVIFIATALIIGFCMVIYFLLYGILMRKLNKNYAELKRLDL